MARVRLDKLIEYWDPVLKKAFLDSIKNVKGLAQIGQIADALERGDVEAALRILNLDPVNFRPLDKAIVNAFEAGGNATAAVFPLLGQPGELRVVFQFDVRNPVAEQWIATYSSNLITEIVDDQRNMVRTFLERNLAAGNNGRAVALDLVGRVSPSGVREGGVIGLTSSQEEWVSNYATELASDNPGDALSRTLRDRRFDATVKKAIDSGEPIPQELQDKMVATYRNRALRYRAEIIGRTESMAALHEAQQQAMQQAVDSGAITQDQVTFIWRTAEDDRVRDSHVAMDGQEVPMGEMFVSGLGNYLEYPGDPNGPPEDVINCRCWREPSVDFLAGIE